jgi:glycosyltransferase involved in cell wall biosynthesis
MRAIVAAGVFFPPSDVRFGFMLFSIAIPVRGQADLLPTALASIEAQSAQIELAVMDATPDTSVQDVLAAYHGTLAYRRHGPDDGQAAAIQEGWDRTNGEVLCWLCADDYYFPDALQQVRHIFEAEPDVDVVYGDSVFVNREGNFLGYHPEVSPDISAILRGCCISQPSCFVRRSAIAQAGGLDTKLHYVMDWNLWCRLYKDGAKFRYLPSPLSAVRVYPETKTASRSKERYAEINRQLAMNTDNLTRMRALAGFYHYDLASRRSTLAERLLFIAISGLRAARKALSGRSGISGKRFYGIEAHSNQVQEACEVGLPTYGLGSPIRITSIAPRHPHWRSAPMASRCKPSSPSRTVTATRTRRFARRRQPRCSV